MSVELIDVLDEHGAKTGQTLPRSEVHKKGLWHKIVVVGIVDKDKNILMQQRAADKDKNPNMWDISLTGHITAGQDSVSTVGIEINEELAGLEFDLNNLDYIFTYTRQQYVGANHFDRQFYDFYILHVDNIDLDKIKVQEEEVQAIKLISSQELKEMIANNQVVERNETYNELFIRLFGEEIPSLSNKKLEDTER